MVDSPNFHPWIDISWKQEINVSSPVSGLIETIAVATGTSVEREDLLVRVAPQGIQCMDDAHAVNVNGVSSSTPNGYQAEAMAT